MIANQVTINPEREARYLFTKPYTYSHGVIVTAADNHDITTLKDLKGKTTAQSATSNWFQVAKDAGAKVENVDQFAQAVALLDQGRVDAVVNDNIAVLDYLASTGSKKIKIAGNAGDEISRQALTFRKSDTALRDEADKALAEIRADGTLQEDLGEVLQGRCLRGEVRQGVGQGLGHRTQQLAGAEGRSLADVSRCPAGDHPADGDLVHRRPGHRVGGGPGEAFQLPAAGLAGPRLHLDHPRDAAAGAAVHRVLRTRRGGHRPASATSQHAWP